MSISRYQNDLPIRNGKILKTASTVSRLRRLYRTGGIAVREVILKENERIDQIAGKEMGESSLWWIIAALSDIGWSMQLPPGTILRVPVDVQQLTEII
jgi:hypothetical protein